MKKIAALLLAALLVIGCCTAVAEEAKPLAGQTLKIALSPNFMYFETVSEDDPNAYEGLDIDIIACLSEMLGFEYEIVPMDFASLIGSLQTGASDFVISGLSYTEERAQVVDFSMTYCTTDVGCVVPVDSDINATEDLIGKVVCCSAGTTYETLLTAMDVNLKTFNGQAAVGTAVAEGTDNVAAGVTSINGSKKLANTVLTADGQPMLRYFMLEGEGTADSYNIAFPKGSELTAIFDGALQEMIDSGLMGEMIHAWLY